MGRSQEYRFRASKETRKRAPFEWKGLDSDNDQAFINQILHKYCQREKSEFTRSRPNRGKMTMPILSRRAEPMSGNGYLRCDTPGELMIINDLYRNELRPYKNFFQPMMRLVSKERIGGRLNRKHDIPRTPYQKLMDSGQMPKETRRQLEALYLSLDPGQLKRSTDAKLDNLHRTYEEQTKSHHVEP